MWTITILEHFLHIGINEEMTREIVNVKVDCLYIQHLLIHPIVLVPILNNVDLLAYSSGHARSRVSCD